MEITLEQVDKVKERTGVSYAEAKNALELTNGNVLEAIILIEEKSKEENKSGESSESSNDTFNKAETISELKVWLKDLIKKGNIFIKNILPFSVISIASHCYTICC